MASILRSGKIFRYFASLSRSVAFNSVRETEGSLVQNTSCICSNLTHGFATTAAPKPDQSLDKQLKRLDQDVRRTGRISRRDIEEILDEIRLQRSATSSQSLLVIRCCGNLVPEELPEVRTALVQEIWKTLNTLNVPMDISHYNALLRVYLENEHPFSPTDFLADLEAKGVEPNRVTYQRLITRYCQQGDIEGATQILEFMREKGLPVNESVFNALILGHSQANDLESAAGILSVMKQAGLEATADTYTTLCTSYARHGDLDSILRILDECEKNEIFLLDKDLLDIVYSLTINGHGDKVDQVLSRMRKLVGYNQDAVNVILRLTNKGYEDVAFKILKTMPRSTRRANDGEVNDTGNFFIRQLVRASRPIEKTIAICKQMQEEGLNSKALIVATEAGLSHGIPSGAFSLLRELKNAGQPIRQHYFWPLICSSESNQIVEVLQRMQEEFSINPNSETIREYVIPNLNEKNWDRVISVLRNAGISNGTAASAAAYNALNAFKLKEAANIAENYKAFFPPGLFRKPLIAALGKTNDYNSFVRFVRQVYDNIPRGASLPSQNAEEDSAEPAERPQNQSEVLGQIVLDAAVYFKNNRVEAMERILSGLVQQGLTLSNYHAEKIQERLGSDMTSEISELLGKLSSGELEPIQVERTEKVQNRTLDNMTVAELERFIANSEKKGENVNGLKRHLINACFRSKDLAKTEAVIDRLEKENYNMSTGIYAQLIDLYVHHNQLDSAIAQYEKLRSKDPAFNLDNFKAIRVAQLFANEGKIDEAVAFLTQNQKAESTSEAESTFNYKTTCWRLLNSIAETGNAENLQKVFDALVTNNYVQPGNVLLGPLVKVHLVRDDIKAAIDKFEEICGKYQSTPWKNELACRLIQAEDATNLQRLTDLSTNIHGEVNSLYDLVFSFVECGRIRQARKILETPGLRSRPQRINIACERYRQEGMVEPLEGLIEATKDLSHIDRNEIYYNLLLSYCKEDKPEKALGLWTKMQEEDIQPTDVFLLKLSDFLKQKNIEVPFVVPEKRKASSEKTTQPAHKQTQKKTQPTPAPAATKSNLQVFKAAVKTGDVDAALSAKKQLNTGERASISDTSALIESLVKTDRVSEATKLVEEMLQSKLHPAPKVFKFYLNKLANSGDLATLDKLSPLVSNETKKLVSFDNRYCHANIVAGKGEAYLKKLKDELENAKNEEAIKIVAEKFPRGGALGILESHPELAGQFEELAEKYAAKGFLAPVNVLWIHHFVTHNEEACKNLWEKHLKAAPRLMFQRVLQVARETKDDKLAANLLKNLREAKISEGALGNAYSCYLDVLTANEKAEESLEALKTAINDVCLDNINRTALIRVKTLAESKGLSFPYHIPEKKVKADKSSTSSSSSSSSDDDDVTPPRPETIPRK